MGSGSVFVPRGFWLDAVLLWATGLIGLSYLGTVEAARGLSLLDCRLPDSDLAPRACLAEREAFWFQEGLRNNVPWMIVFGLVLPVLVQAALRGFGRKLRP